MVGHSFSQADRDFALIEKRWKVTKQCQIPNDVMKAIREAHPSRPFKVLDMKGKFIGFDSAVASMIGAEKLKITKYSWLRVDRDQPGIIQDKENFNDLTDFEMINVFKRGVTLEKIARMELNSLPAEVPLNDTKKKDLRSMIDFIHPCNRDFYENMIQE